MNQFTSLFLVLFCLGLFSCNSKMNHKESSAAIMADAAYEQIEGAVDPLSLSRKLVKEGDIRFQTKNANQTREKILKAVSASNGYLAKDNIDNNYRYNERIEYNLTIRVPANNFDKLMYLISENAENMEAKNVNVIDVTEEFVDIEARVRTKKELEERYKDLLKKANKVSEILEIEKEIGTLRTEIESIEGRFRYLKERISYSVLNVAFYEKDQSHYGFIAKFLSAVKIGWKYMLDFFIGIVMIWPFLLIGIGIILLWQYKRKNKRKKNMSSK